MLLLPLYDKWDKFLNSSLEARDGFFQSLVYFDKSRFRHCLGTEKTQTKRHYSPPETQSRGGGEGNNYNITAASFLGSELLETMEIGT